MIELPLLSGFYRRSIVSGEATMNLSAPTTIVFIISAVLFIVALIARYGGVHLPLEAVHWALLAWIVLAAGNLMKGL